MARTFGAAFLFAGAFYLLLIDTTTSPELYAGAAATLLAAGVCAAASRNGLRGIRAVAARPAAIAQAIARIPTDIVRLSAAAVGQLVSPRTPRGVMRAVPVRHGDLENPSDVGRRALAEAVGSLAPNTIVIGIDEERDLLLAHQLRAGGGRDSIDVLELG